MTPQSVEKNFPAIQPDEVFAVLLFRRRLSALINSMSDNSALDSRLSLSRLLLGTAYASLNKLLFWLNPQLLSAEPIAAESINNPVLLGHANCHYKSIPNWANFADAALEEAIGQFSEVLSQRQSLWRPESSRRIKECLTAASGAQVAIQSYTPRKENVYAAP